MAQRKFIIDGGFSATADSELTGNLEMTGHILPTVDSDGTTGYDLGSPDMKWRDLYLSQGSLYIDGQKVIESNSGTIVVQADPDQSLTTKVSGSGVMTLESATTVNMAATLQMQTGKKITDQGGNAVVFGDKVDMDQNQIINIGTPTADGHAANKSYVDGKFGDVIGGAPAALDTLNELANALGDDADYAASITTALSTKATTAYVDSEISTLSASVAAGAYGDSDVSSFLGGTTSVGTIKGNIEIDQNKVLQIFGRGSDKGRIVYEAEIPGGADVDYDLLGSAGTSNQFPTLRAYQFEPIAGQSDIILQPGGSGGNVMVRNRRIQQLSNPSNPDDAANKSYVDAEISTLSAAVTAGAYDDSDAKTYLEAYDGNINLDATKTISYKDFQNNSQDIIRVTEAGGSANGAVIAASYFTQLDPNLDFRIATSSKNVDFDLNSGHMSLANSQIKLVGTPTDATDAATKGYVDAEVATAITTAATDATSKADAAEDNAIASAAADATTKADDAESAAIAAAALDATAKANAAKAEAISEVTGGAGAAFDTLVEIQNAMATDAELSSAISSVTSSATATAAADATAKADAAEAAAISAAAADATAKANAAESAAVSAAAATSASNSSNAEAAAISASATDATAKADAAEAAAISAAAADATAKANAAESAASSVANSLNSAMDTRVDVLEGGFTVAGSVAKALYDAKAYTDNLDTSLSSDIVGAQQAAQSFASSEADTAKAEAISAAATDATSKADAAEASAISAAASDATAKANAAQATAISTASADATSKANAAQATAISTASADATSKANAAQAAAIAAVTNGAGAAFDTLVEIQNAMATDAELSSAISNVTSAAAATASADATAKADAALVAAKAYADANDANTDTWRGIHDSPVNGATTTSISSNWAFDNVKTAVPAGAVFTDTNTNTTYSAGNGLSLSGTTFSMSGAYTGSFTATGDITAYSDDSLKTNIQTIDGALSRVEAVRGVTFDRIEDGSTSTGVVAQELQAVLPEAVHTDANGIRHVAYGNITGLLIEAVKELSAEVKELKGK